MSFQRILTQTGKDGRLRKLYPFHISLEGMESVLLCRDDEDYDHLQKSFYLSAWKMGCRVVSEIAMSNHGHVALLSSGIEQARRVGELIKKRHSQYISWKYGDSKLLKRSDICVKYLDTDWYVRNALAYIPRNAVGTGGRVEDYRWSSYRGMFVAGRCPSGIRRVADLSSRERERLFHSHEDLTGVPWVLNADGNLEPVSACDFQYLESAFNHDQAFYLKTIGSVNEAEMRQMLVLNGREKQADVEMQAIISRLAEKWYGKTILELSPEQKAHLLPYLYRCYRTTIPQLARCLRMPRDLVADLIPKRGHGDQQGSTPLQVEQ